jgi:cytochrome c2
MSEKTDPTVTSSLSWHIAVAMALLMAATGWAVYDEFWGRRPWKRYQLEFVQWYGLHLQELEKEAEAREKEVRGTDDFQAMEGRLREEEARVEEEIQAIDQQLNDLNPRISVLSEAIKPARSEITALTYKLEVADDESAKEGIRRRIEAIARGPFSVDGRIFDRYEGLVDAWNCLKDERGLLIQRKGTLLKPANALRGERDEFLKSELKGLSTEQFQGLKKKLEEFDFGIRQIHVAEIGLVDRCETCHLGIREPVEITREQLAQIGLQDPSLQTLFVSHPAGHPEVDLLKIHNPERFGCITCHGGNGTATRSPAKGHGRYKHWLWPLRERENTEAGCLQCHEADLALDGAPTLNAGKEIFRERGCWGCHRREGFDEEPERLKNLQVERLALRQQRKEIERAVGEAEAVVDDRASSDEQVDEALARIDSLTLRTSGLSTEEEQLNLRERNLIQERKRPGPNLKEIRAKLRKEWLPAWIRAPHAFRPDTRMPTFRLSEDQTRAIAAFLWQSAPEEPIPTQPPGDPTRGQELFEKRGCLACHSIGDGNGRIGSDFAADLSRVGEKVNYDYLVRWIHNPKERLLPYSPRHQRDLNRKDYEEKGIPFLFDRQHTTFPASEGPVELVVENPTVMPNLRLSWEESRDIASFLLTRRDKGTVYPEATYLEDPALLSEGAQWVRHFGCAGCHEIKGFESEGRIGTELTKEGSKPIERLDFGLLTHDFKTKGGYDHKHFFKSKLADPAIFDQGKEKAEHEKLRMPNFRLNEAENTALTTFLLGSVDSQIMDKYFHTSPPYRPTDSRKALQEGWWVLKKYNCVGCHQVEPDQTPSIQRLSWYEGENVTLAPPSLVGVGARIDPNWLARFLDDPSMTEDSKESHRNGLRAYLQIRMPTFSLSQDEIEKLVRFFAAVSSQPIPEQGEKLPPLSPEEKEMARDAFAASDCLKCHATGDPSTFTADTTAPNLASIPGRTKPRWLRRWLTDPAKLMPGTKMPSGLFKKDETDRWIINGPIPESMKSYSGDHVALFVRYLMEYDAAEAQEILKRE